MSEESEQNFLSVVARIFSAWSGLQIAVDQASGGSETKEKYEWLSEITCERVSETRAQAAEELEGWLNNILYHDFDLILEDDSVYITACLLLEAFGYFKNGNSVRLNQLLSALPSAERISEVRRNLQAVEGDEDEEMDLENFPEDEEIEEEESQPSNEPVQARRRHNVTDDDGWTTIVKK